MEFQVIQRYNTFILLFQNTKIKICFLLASFLNIETRKTFDKGMRKDVLIYIAVFVKFLTKVTGNKDETGVRVLLLY